MDSESITAETGVEPVGQWDAVRVKAHRSIVPFPKEAAPFPEVADKTYFVNLFPSVQINLTRDCAWWMRMLPSSPEKTHVQMGFLFPKETTEMPNFEAMLAPYLHRWHVAVVEDNEISENQQTGAYSPFNIPGTYNHLEFATHAFDRFVLGRVLEDPIQVYGRPTAAVASSGGGGGDGGAGGGATPLVRSSVVQRQTRLLQQQQQQQQQQRGFSATSARPLPAASQLRQKNRLAVVTGAGRDIGAATALRLASEGASVVIHCHASREGADEVAASIIGAGGRASVVQSDLTTDAGAQALVATAKDLYWAGNNNNNDDDDDEEEFRIDVLVHNAGGMVERRTLREMNTEFLADVFDINFTSLFLAAHHCVPHMGTGGAIVTVSSQAARDGGGPGAGAYAASKGAVHTYTRSLAKELGSQGIRVNTVTPGMIDTGFHDVFSKPEVRTHVAGLTLVGREGRSEEVASTIAFLASDDASYLTGNALDINGGLAFSA